MGSRGGARIVANQRPGVEEIFHAVILGRQSEAHEAQAALLTLKPEDRRGVTVRLLDSLSRERPSGAVLDERDKAWTRAWILNTLALVTETEPDAAKAVHEYLDSKVEPSDFVRFWILQGLVQADAPDVVEVASRLSAEVGAPMVNPQAERNWILKLSLAVLARNGDDAAQKGLEDTINDLDTLRALAFVYLPITVDALVAIVSGKDISTGHHRALEALGRVPPRSAKAREVARALMDFVEKRRTQSLWDGMRCDALKALGGLKEENSVFTVVDQLEDDNPAVVRAAAQSLESILETARAVDRVVDEAVQTGLGDSAHAQIEALGRALRWMDEKRVVDSLEAAMVSGTPEREEAARQLLVEVGGSAAFQKLRARAQAVEKYAESVVEADRRIQDMFNNSMNEARTGYRLSAWMDGVIFGVGVFLIVTSAVLILARGQTLDVWAGGATGVGGTLGILYGSFYSNPRRKLEDAVDHVMALKLIFLAYLRQLHQVDEAYTRLLLEEKLSTEDINKFAEMVKTIMFNAMAQLRTLRVSAEEAPPAGPPGGEAGPPAGGPAKPQGAATPHPGAPGGGGAAQPAVPELV